MRPHSEGLWKHNATPFYYHLLPIDYAWSWAQTFDAAGGSRSSCGSPTAGCGSYWCRWSKEAMAGLCIGCDFAVP